VIGIQPLGVCLRASAYGLIAGSILLGNLRAANAQTLPSQMDDVTFTLDIPGTHPPVKIIKVLLDGKPIDLDRPVHVSGNWVSRIAVEMQNVSTKDIVFGELILDYPETGDNGPILSSISRTGREPAAAFRLRDGTMHDIPAEVARRLERRARPGDMLHYDFAADEITLSKAYQLHPHLHTVKLIASILYFADETKWTGGIFLKPVPAPTLWQEVPGEEFLPKVNPSRLSSSCKRQLVGEQS